MTLPQRDWVDRDVHHDEIQNPEQRSFDVSRSMYGEARGGVLDCRCNDGERDNLKSSISDRDCLEQSDKESGSHRNGLNGWIPDIKC